MEILNDAFFKLKFNKYIDFYSAIHYFSNF